MKQPTKAQRLALKRENNKWSATMARVPRKQWPFDDGEPRISVWRSREFFAQVFEAGEGVRISVNRARLDSHGRWSDRISWDELQAIKRQIGFGDLWAFEIFPPDSDVVNVANMRHLWIPGEPPVFGWRR